MKHFDFDLIVVGAGHAGTEAAHVGARMGLSVALITMKESDIGALSCNPAIGGLGKGHLVREIDALDGIMGRVADRSGIQFRLLNRRKGPAVRGPRAQMDRDLYKTKMLAELQSMECLTIIYDTVDDIIIEESCVKGVSLSSNQQVSAQKVILTTGTFLRGIIHIGQETHEAGRMGDSPSNRLAQRLEGLKLPLGRLKTGTPPRLLTESIAWDALEKQPGDKDPSFFSFDSRDVSATQVNCAITHTNPETHKIIEDNLKNSAMYSGRIDGVGPRYCPSIEDKIVRFKDKSSHQVFLEPEGLKSNLIYPNGISTSLPIAVQIEYVRSIYGLEHAEIVQPGYAIEYDFVDPRCLNSNLEVPGVFGLHLAGQINGTTGYEEAGAQGIVAGIAASCLLKDVKLPKFTRDNSYIGVMIDDLTTKGVSEPYRMFTSRAEYRLSLRADNADQRLTPLGIEVGCISKERAEAFSAKQSQLQLLTTTLKSITVSQKKLTDMGLLAKSDGKTRSLYDVLAFPDVNFDTICEVESNLSEFSQDVSKQVVIDAKYHNYVERHKRQIESTRKDSDLIIPDDFVFADVPGLSVELQSKLDKTRPENMAQVGRIEGMTPAAMTLIASLVKGLRKASV